MPPSFLESVPEVAAKLKEAHTKERKFEDVVKTVEQAVVIRAGAGVLSRDLRDAQVGRRAVSGGIPKEN